MHYHAWSVREPLPPTQPRLCNGRISACTSHPSGACSTCFTCSLTRFSYSGRLWLYNRYGSSRPAAYPLASSRKSCSATSTCGPGYAARGLTRASLATVLRLREAKDPVRLLDSDRWRPIPSLPVPVCRLGWIDYRKADAAVDVDIRVK